MIDAGAVRNGIELATYSLETWRGIFGDRDATRARGLAMKLYTWMLDRPGWATSETAILRVGPKALRSKARRDTALATLEAHGLANRGGSTWELRSTL